MSTPEEIANMLLEKQGFIVVGTTGPLGPFGVRCGDIISGCVDDDFGHLDHPLVVIGESNAAEWNQQRAHVGLPPQPIPEGARLYRVVAE